MAESTSSWSMEDQMEKLLETMETVLKSQQNMAKNLEEKIDSMYRNLEEKIDGKIAEVYGQTPEEIMQSMEVRSRGINEETEEEERSILATKSMEDEIRFQTLDHNADQKNLGAGGALSLLGSLYGFGEDEDHVTEDTQEIEKDAYGKTNAANVPVPKSNRPCGCTSRNEQMVFEDMHFKIEDINGSKKGILGNNSDVFVEVLDDIPKLKLGQNFGKLGVIGIRMKSNKKLGKSWVENVTGFTGGTIFARKYWVPYQCKMTKEAATSVVVEDVGVGTWVVTHSSHVTVDFSGSERVVEAMKDSVPRMEWDFEGIHYLDNDPLTVQYLLVLDALNLCFFFNLGDDKSEMIKVNRGSSSYLADHWEFSGFNIGRPVNFHDDIKLVDLNNKKMELWELNGKVVLLEDKRVHKRRVELAKAYYDGLSRSLAKNFGYPLIDSELGQYSDNGFSGSGVCPGIDQRLEGVELLGKTVEKTASDIKLQEVSVGIDRIDDLQINPSPGAFESISKNRYMNDDSKKERRLISSGPGKDTEVKESVARIQCCIGVVAPPNMSAIEAPKLELRLVDLKGGDSGYVMVDHVLYEADKKTLDTVIREPKLNKAATNIANSAAKGEIDKEKELSMRTETRNVILEPILPREEETANGKVKGVHRNWAELVTVFKGGTSWSQNFWIIMPHLLLIDHLNKKIETFRGISPQEMQHIRNNHLCFGYGEKLSHSHKCKQGNLHFVVVKDEELLDTFGEQGRNVVLESKYGSPKIANDGVTVAKEVKLEDTVENIGVNLVRQAASKISDLAGDMTTTSVILAQCFTSVAIKVVAAGASPSQNSRGIEQTTKAPVAEREWISKEVKDNELADVAVMSAGNNYKVRNMITEAMSKVGRKRVVILEEGQGTDNQLHVVKAMQFDRSYIFPYFATDDEKKAVEYVSTHVIAAGIISVPKNPLEKMLIPCDYNLYNFFITKSKFQHS